MDSLSADRRLKVDELKAASGINDEDLLIALLEQNDWNLQNTMNFLIGEHESETESLPLVDRTQPQPPVLRNQHNRTGLLTLFFLPFTLSLKIISLLFKYIFGFLNFGQTKAVKPQDGKSTAARFLLEFEQMYGTTHVEFYQGGYSQAMDVAKNELKYLLAILYSPEHDDSDAFCREVLCSEEVAGYLRENHFMVWIGDIQESEPYQVSNLLGATTYPFIALISMQSSRMTVMDRLEGLDDAQLLRTHLSRHLPRLQAQVANLRAERQVREQERQMRTQQEQAYQASLSVDEEKRRLKLQEQERKRQEEEKRKSLVDMKKKRKEMKLARKEELQKNMPPEPTADDETITKVSMRLPNGTRLVRKFNAHDPVQVLADFIEAQDLEPIPISSEFDIVNTYPRNIISGYSKSLRDAGLYPNGAIIIEERVESSDDDN